MVLVSKTQIFIKYDKYYFIVLAKMPKKGITKTRISITIDKELVSLLNKECDKRTMKLSSYIEKLIKFGFKNE